MENVKTELRDRIARLIDSEFSDASWIVCRDVAESILRELADATDEKSTRRRGTEMTNWFGMNKIHRGMTIHQGPDDRFYAPWPEPLFEADTYENLIEEIDALTNMEITNKYISRLADDAQRDAFLVGYGCGLRDGRVTL